MSENITPLMIKLARAADGGFEAEARAGGTTVQQQLHLPQVQSQPASLASAEQIGMQLGGALLAEGLGALYGQLLEQTRASGGRLGIYLQITDRELERVPWELLYDQQNGRFIGLSARTLLARCASANLIQPLTLAGPLRVLALAAGADGTPDAAEQAQLRAHLAALGGTIELRWAATWTDLQRELAGGSWHVLHLIAHDTLSDGTGRLAVTDQQGAYRLGSAQLALVLEEQSTLRLVIIDGRGDGGGARQIAAALARSAVAALALQRDPEHTLAQNIYGALHAGRPLELALAEARKTLALADPEGWLWGALLLALTGPPGVLFTQQPTPAAPAAPVIGAGGVYAGGDISGNITTGDINQSGGVMVHAAQIGSIGAVIGSAGSVDLSPDQLAPALPAPATPAIPAPAAPAHRQAGIQPIFVTFQRELRQSQRDPKQRTTLSALLRQLERELLRGQRADLLRITRRTEDLTAIDSALASALLAALANPTSGAAPELIAAIERGMGEQNNDG